MSNNISSFYQFISSFEKYKNKEALWTSDSSIKYDYISLSKEIKAFSQYLSKKIKPGERVILVDLHGPHWVIAFFSIILNKGIAVPLDNRMNEDLQNEIIKLVNARFIITCERRNNFKLRNIIYEEVKTDDYNEWQLKKINLDTPAEIIFTSGTWGAPKGVVLTHKNLISNLNSLRKVYTPKEDQKLLSILPLSHAYEQMCGLFLPLSFGCKIIYQQKLDSESLIKSLQTFKINYIVVVPKFLEILQNSILKKFGKFKTLFNFLISINKYFPISIRRLIFYFIHKKFGGNLKTFIVGGAPLYKKLDDFFIGLGFNTYIGYGLSESSPALTVSLEENRPNNSVGYSIQNVRIKIANDGEIIARGPNISPGYWPLKKNKKHALYTGDLGYLDKDGRLILTGRKKNMVVFSTGDKIQLEDIENISNEFPGIKESCAYVSGSDNLQKISIVYIGDIDIKKYLRYVNKRLPLFARISSADKYSYPKLPRSHTLKLQRNIITEIMQK